nr:apolipoL family protein [Helicobacter pylori]
MQKAIVTTIDREIDPTIKELEDAQPETYSNLDRSRDKFVSNLNNSVSKEIERFKTDFRIEMYARIEKDIENKECKEIFENECEQRTEKLRENIRRCFNECEEQFSKDIKEDIEQFEEKIENSLVMLNHINLDSGFDINFNIHSGIDKLSLFSSLGGLVFGIFNFWNFAGWTSIGLGLVGIVKSVWSWFSSDYKKSQQRKEVDKNLDKVCGIIEERVRNYIEGVKKGIFEKVESLKTRLNDSVVCYERMRKRLIKAGKGLWHLSDNIKTRIVQ